MFFYLAALRLHYITRICHYCKKLISSEGIAEQLLVSLDVA